MYNFPDTPETVFDYLMNQLPSWFKPVEEYIQIMKAWSVPMANIIKDAEQIQANFFVQTADTATLTELERLIGISALPTDPIAYRRERILTQMQQQAPYTEWHLRDKLTELFGSDYTLTIDPVNLDLTIFTTSQRYGAVDLLNRLIALNIPAHLNVTSNQEVVRYIQSNQYLAASVTNTVVRDIPVSA